MQTTSTNFGPGTAAATAQTGQADAPTKRSGALSSDFETFLKMLTVQMKNQDPLNPMESSDFAVQLATFSGVEQQVKTNDLLTKLADGFAGSGIGELAGWIGKEVRSAGSARFDGAPITLHPGSDLKNGESGFLVARDEAGLPIARYPFVGTGEPIVWAGAAADGTPLPNGLYRFDVEVMNGEQVARTVPVEHYARVAEVRTGATGPVLVMEGGATVAPANVTAVRVPGP
jgi:flagellar basal-body rod modification protein FlgD